MKFKELNLKQFIIDSIEELRFDNLTEIQEKVIPLLLKDNNIIGKSQTGSGKTHSFLIPIFNKLDIDKKEVQSIITAPTRELANQIYEVANQIAKFSNEIIDIRLYCGGTDRNREISKLEYSQPHIVIGTPGKIADLALKENVLIHTTANTFIVDEADMTLETGFLEDIDRLLEKMPEKSLLSVFSATIPEVLQQFLKKYITNPIFIEINPSQITSLKLENYLIPLKNKDRDKFLSKLLNIINPYLCLIFCNKKETVDDVYSLLYSNKLNVCKLHGDLEPRERKRIMSKINKLEVQFIVASDIASRGIDIEGVSHVVNYDLPKQHEFYIHRIGRTARANHTGIAYSFFEQMDDDYLTQLEKKGLKFEYKTIINDELVEAKDRNARKNRIKTVTEEVKEARIKVKRSKKVKPGYKKKYNEEVSKMAKKIRRKKR